MLDICIELTALVHATHSFRLIGNAFWPSFCITFVYCLNDWFDGHFVSLSFVLFADALPFLWGSTFKLLLKFKTQHRYLFFRLIPTFDVLFVGKRSLRAHTFANDFLFVLNSWGFFKTAPTYFYARPSFLSRAWSFPLLQSCFLSRLFCIIFALNLFILSFQVKLNNSLDDFFLWREPTAFATEQKASWKNSNKSAQ